MHPVVLTSHETAPFAMAASPPIESMSCLITFACAGLRPSSLRLQWNCFGVISLIPAGSTPMRSISNRASSWDFISTDLILKGFSVLVLLKTKPGKLFLEKPFAERNLALNPVLNPALNLFQGCFSIVSVSAQIYKKVPAKKVSTLLKVFGRRRRTGSFGDL